jgi:hypothetical protein
LVARVHLQDSVAAPAVSYFLAVNYDDLQNSSVHLQPASTLLIAARSGQDFQIALVDGSEIFIQSNPFPDGVRVDLAGSDLQFYAVGCLSVDYRLKEQVKVGCFLGLCEFGVRSQPGVQTIRAGEEWTFDAGTNGVTAQGPLPPAVIGRYYDELLARTTAGLTDRDTCIGQAGLVTPTPTATPTYTPSRPAVNAGARSATPVPTSVPTNKPGPEQPQNTAVPPTNTLVPPTLTPVPPTNTLVPPTNTPVPIPTTAVPPTNTLVPPTNTPVPIPTTAVPPTNTPETPTNTPVPDEGGPGPPDKKPTKTPEPSGD